MNSDKEYAFSSVTSWGCRIPKAIWIKKIFLKEKTVDTVDFIVTLYFWINAFAAISLFWGMHPFKMTPNDSLAFIHFLSIGQTRGKGIYMWINWIRKEPLIIRVFVHFFSSGVFRLVSVPQAQHQSPPT